MLLRLVLVLFFLSSCGGGSGSSSDGVTIENNPINVKIQANNVQILMEAHMIEPLDVSLNIRVLIGITIYS